MKRVGKVYLVGAGPGDPGLLTLKGKQCLQRADVLFYDALVNPQLLDFASEKAEKIFVGKRGGQVSTHQGKIEQRMIRQARKGKVVVRLKGGDPYLFGRGAEEAETLKRQRIPFEVVPGVTSALAAPCYAGIPLTHRRYSSSVGFVTGHEDPAKPKSRIQWEELSKSVDTLVFLMGVSQLPSIVSRLLKSGKSKKTSAALIEWGTMPQQRTVTGSLGGIVQKAKREKVKPPAILVIGEVVRLRNSLNWFEKKPLLGKRILVTRPKHQIPEFRTLLEEQGASPVELPMIAISPLRAEGLKKTIGQRSWDWVVFTSSNGVNQFLRQLKALQLDIRVLKEARLCAIGPKTARRLNAAGLRVDLVPEEEFRAEGIVEAFRRHSSLDHPKILLVRAEEGRSVLPEGLREMGAEVEDLAVYRTEPVKHPPSVVRQIKKELAQGKIHAVTFTSPSSVNSFLASFGKANLKKTKVASLGPVTSAELKEAGVKVKIEASPYTIEGLTEALARCL